MNKTSKTFSPLTIGLDLGNKTSHVAVLSRDSGEVVESVVATTETALEALFAQHPGARVVFEVGGHSRWVQALAKRMGMEGINANPRELALITKSHKKTDKRDALLLAQLGSGAPQLLSAVEHRSPQVHADLAVVKTRAHLVAMRTSCVNRIRGLCKSVGVTLVGCDAAYLFRKAPPLIPAELMPACEPILKMLEALHVEIRAVEKVLEEIALRYNAVKQLTQVDRVGLIVALSFVLTVENPGRFAVNRDIGAYVGLTPRRQDSGDRVTQLGISKAGDRDLRRLLVLSANQILSSRGKDCDLRRWGLELCRRGGANAKKRALCAVARKLSVLLLALWKSGSAYEPMRNVNELEAA